MGFCFGAAQLSSEQTCQAQTRAVAAAGADETWNRSDTGGPRIMLMLLTWIMKSLMTRWNLEPLYVSFAPDVLDSPFSPVVARRRFFPRQT